MGSVLRQAFALKKKLNKDGLLLQSILAVTDHLELYVTKHGEPLGWTFVFRTSVDMSLKADFYPKTSPSTPTNTCTLLRACVLFPA